jgi:hypothetical protein
MPQTYATVITNLGAAKIAAALADNTSVQLTQMSVGDGGGNLVTPDPTQTSLVRETYRTNINSLTQDANNPDWLIAEMVIDPTDGGWTVREVGLFDNTGTLIAVANFPDTYKPLLTDGSSQNLVVRIYLQVTNPGVLSISIDPNVVVATRVWVEDNFSLAALMPGGLTGYVLAKKSNADGDVEWYDPVAGYNITVNTVEENQVASAGQTVVNLTVAGTANMSVYQNGLRLRANQFTVNSPTQFTLGTGAAAGDKLTMVQNEPASASQFLQKTNNLSEIQAAGPAAQAAAVANLGLAPLTSSAAVAAVLAVLYPVGEILITHRSANPSTWLGGTWAPYAQGQVLVGYKAGDPNFGALDKTGGEVAHTLTTSELAAHSHTNEPPAANTAINGDHSHSVGPISATTGSVADHTHEVAYGQNSGTYPGPGTEGLDIGSTEDSTWQTSPAGGHSHAVSVPAFNTGNGGSHQHSVAIPPYSSDPAGGNAAHNNLQPFTTVFMWLRTA